MIGLALRVLHIGLAAAWFGHKLLIPADLSDSLVDQERAHALIPRLARAERLGVATGVGTLASGLILAWHVGFATVGVGVWVGLGLVLVAIGLGATMARPASAGLIAGITSKDLPAARNAATRVQQVLAAESVLWATALVAMLL